jgi:hypothetical protein
MCDPDVQKAAQVLGGAAGGSNRDVDPYSTAVGRITEALRKAYSPIRAGRMNEDEFQILITVGRTLKGLDPAVNLNIPKENR